MDEYSETDLWAPYYGETPKPHHADAANYPPCPGYVISCFRQLCKLCIILNDLMQDIYSPEAAARREDNENSAEAKAATEEPFIRISRDLRDWLICLPPNQPRANSATSASSTYYVAQPAVPYHSYTPPQAGDPRCPRYKFAWSVQVVSSLPPSDRCNS
jgi:hypothetical protein